MVGFEPLPLHTANVKQSFHSCIDPGRSSAEASAFSSALEQPFAFSEDPATLAWGQASHALRRLGWIFSWSGLKSFVGLLSSSRQSGVFCCLDSRLEKGSRQRENCWMILFESKRIRKRSLLAKFFATWTHTQYTVCDPWGQRIT